MPWRLAQLEPEYWSVTVQQVVKRALKPGLIDCRRLPDIVWRGLPSGVAPTRPPAGRRRCLPAPSGGAQNWTPARRAFHIEQVYHGV